MMFFSPLLLCLQLAELEKRLGELESAVRCDQDPQASYNIVNEFLSLTYFRGDRHLLFCCCRILSLLDCKDQISWYVAGLLEV